MLCSRFLRFTAHQRHGRLYQISERGFDFIAHVYDRTLVITMRHGIVTMSVSFLLLFGTFYLFTTMPKGFIPSQDSGFMFGLTQAAQGSSFDYMVSHQDEVIKIVRADPNTESVFSFVGAGFVGAMNTGIFFVKAKPRDERPNSVDGMIDELRPKLMFQVPGMIAFMQNPPPISVSGQITKSLYALTLGGPDTRDLYKWAPILTAKINALPGFADVSSDLQIASPQITVDINRDKAQAVGVTPQQIEDALYTAYGDRQISTIYTPANEYQVIAEVLPEYQNNPAALSRLYIRATGGTLIPLDTVATMSRTVGPVSVQHSGQLPAVTISFNLKPGVSLGEAADRVNETVRDLQMPATITTNFQGTVQAFQTSFKGLSILLIVAIAVIYLVLGILYESFIHPITILWGLPSAVVGALITLKIFHMDLDLFALVGLVMLFGIVKKNAIMMIDFALDAQRTRDIAPAQAIYQGALMRFRPIMMTTMAALFGTLPIALGFGAGAESRRPLGMAVVGGLLVSQLLTLYITPVTYVYMEKFRALFTRHQPKPELVQV
jgi:HAE1 family hydrophobic/amphiphilic exporter-1